MQENSKHIEEDEIDLRELFKTIWDKKVFILLFTGIVTIVSIVYVLLKNPTPIYQGKMYIEIGKIQDKNFVPALLESPNDLSQILKLELNVNASTLKGTTKIVEVIFNNENKDLINEKLIETKNFIIEKHKEESSFYENTLVTKQIGNIEISSEAINKPKKSLIVVVAFVTGFILSIFLVFFLQFVQTMRKES